MPIWAELPLVILEYKKVAGAEERKEVWELLKKHAEMERKHKDFLAEMKKLTDTPALKYIFEQIWNDEKIHHAMLETMMTKRFEKDPAKYAPQFGGFCAYAVSLKKLKPVDVNICQIEDGRLLLQFSRDAYELFNKDKKESLKRADANWPGLVARNGK